MAAEVVRSHSYYRISGEFLVSVPPDMEVDALMTLLRNRVHFPSRALRLVGRQVVVDSNQWVVFQSRRRQGDAGENYCGCCYVCGDRVPDLPGPGRHPERTCIQCDLGRSDLVCQKCLRCFRHTLAEVHFRCIPCLRERPIDSDSGGLHPRAALLWDQDAASVVGEHYEWFRNLRTLDRSRSIST